VPLAELQLLRCPACGATNRVQGDKLADGLQPVCGRCKRPLLAGPVTITDASFEGEVLRSPLPVLVDMWAPWCGPCRMIAPALEELAVEFAGSVRIAKLNVDENPATSERFAVRNIPTLLLFKDGREVDRIVGALPKAEIARRVAQAVSVQSRHGTL
jgi:thioredoxin 2